VAVGRMMAIGDVTHYKIEITSYFTCKKHRGANCSFLQRIALAPSDLLQIKKKQLIWKL
jgi:hypothetical protein